ncbi:ATP-dependent protease LonB [archaeon]|nr:ATP-dependent protease LonB [archaeon]
MDITTEKITKIEKIKYDGYLYNLTTETGNVFANGILVKNSGGLGTPAYERLIPGLVHKANGGVLHIDEIASLPLVTQQKLLTVLQEKKFSITGQHEQSSGASVVSTPAPADFVLVASGNLDTIKHMHPALRSRIRGYGYEVYMDEVMDDTPKNRILLAQFIAQEVEKDKKIPHFSRAAAESIVTESKKLGGRAGKLTLRFRELGGLIRAAGDVAKERGHKLVTPADVIAGKESARNLEDQIADKFIEQKKEYDVILTKGTRIGRVNGLAVLGDVSHHSGIVLPIESEVTPGGKKAEFVATGKLGKIAKEAVQNVSAIIMKYFGTDIKGKYDIYTQFLQTASTGVEGDSASIAVATSIISALNQVPVKQSVAMTGSLSVRGEILAVGGISAKIEAAIEAGVKTIIIPSVNKKDIFIEAAKLKGIKIFYVSRIEEVLEHALDWNKENASILKKLKNNK